MEVGRLCGMMFFRRKLIWVNREECSLTKIFTTTIHELAHYLLLLMCGDTPAENKLSDKLDELDASFEKLTGAVPVE